MVGEVGTRIDVVFTELILFSLFGNGSHRLHCLEGIFTRSRFTAEHQRIGAIVDGIGDVGHFRTSRTWVVDHGVQHLRCHNHGFLRLDTLLNDLALDARNALDGHFDAEVTARNHDTIRSLDNFVDIVYTLLVFNLRDDLDVAVVRIEDVLHHFHVGSRAHEGVSNEINVLLDGKEDIFVVTLSERREVDVLPRHIHTLVRSEHTIIFHFHAHCFTFDGIHLHGDGTIIEEQAVAYLQILGNVGIRKANFIVCRIHPRASIHRDLLSSLVGNGSFRTRSAHFRTFRINQNTYMW